MTERGSAKMIRLFVWIALTAGRRCCLVLLYPITAYFMLTAVPARRASFEFLEQALRRRPTYLESFRHFYSFAVSLLDRIYMSRGQFHRFEIEIEDQELVARTLESGRGCVLLGSHLGSFDLLALVAATLHPRPPVTIMMHVDTRARLRRMIGVDDSDQSIIPLGRPDSFLKAYATVKEGGIIAILADRTGDSASLPISFLGRKTRMPLGPHLLAARAQAPTLFCVGIYEGKNRYKIRFVKTTQTSSHTSHGEEFRPALEEYAQLLEQNARLYPFNWFNFYAYWEYLDEKK